MIALICLLQESFYSSLFQESVQERNSFSSCAKLAQKTKGPLYKSNMLNTMAKIGRLVNIRSKRDLQKKDQAKR